MPTFGTFLALVLSLTGILIGALWGILTYVLELPMPLGYYMMFVFFVVMTLLVHMLLTRAGKKDAKKFVPIFMGVVGFKMMASLIYLLIYIVLNQENAVVFGVSFLVSYFAYTALEVVTLLRGFKAASE